MDIYLQENPWKLMKLSKGIRRGERVVFFWLGDDHHIHAFLCAQHYECSTYNSLKYGLNLPHRDVESQWFPLENDVQMVAFPHPC